TCVAHSVATPSTTATQSAAPSATVLQSRRHDRGGGRGCPAATMAHGRCVLHSPSLKPTQVSVRRTGPHECLYVVSNPLLPCVDCSLGGRVWRPLRARHGAGGWRVSRV